MFISRLLLEEQRSHLCFFVSNCENLSWLQNDEYRHHGSGSSGGNIECLHRHFPRGWRLHLSQRFPRGWQLHLSQRSQPSHWQVCQQPPVEDPAKSVSNFFYSRSPSFLHFETWEKRNLFWFCCSTSFNDPSELKSSRPTIVKRGTASNGVWKPFECPKLDCNTPTPSSPPSSAGRLTEGQGTPLWAFVLGILVVAFLPILKVSKTSSLAIFFLWLFHEQQPCIEALFFLENGRFTRQLLQIWKRQDAERWPHCAQLRCPSHPRHRWWGSCRVGWISSPVSSSIGGHREPVNPRPHVGYVLVYHQQDSLLHGRKKEQPDSIFCAVGFLK